MGIRVGTADDQVAEARQDLSRGNPRGKCRQLRGSSQRCVDRGKAAWRMPVARQPEKESRADRGKAARTKPVAEAGATSPRSFGPHNKYRELGLGI